MNIPVNKFGLMVMLSVLPALLSGCFGSSSNNAASSGGTEVQLSALGVTITGLSATLDITGMGTYAMTVNADTTVSATVPEVSPGLRTFTVTYYADTVVLARVSKVANVVAGQNITISFTAQELDRNFDDDGDGWTNLAEVLWGSEPLLATSTPPSENPVFVLSASGGEVTSASFTVQATVGEGIGSDGGTSLDYALSGGFQAYH
jgi:hypothetical protein